MRATPASVARLLADGRSAYVVHRHADADSVGSAVALARTFGGPIWAPGGVSAPGRRVAEQAGQPVSDVLPPCERFVLLDIANWGQVGAAAERIGAKAHVVLDHHAYGDAFETALAVLRDPARASTCEVALDVLLAAERPPDAASARALLAGLVADSGRFRYGDARTLRAALRLVEAGASLEEAVSDLEEEELDDRSARIARLKAARRARVVAIGDRVLATGVVTSHEAACASGLVRLGADAALVATASEEGARVSARARAGFPVHLGEMLHALASERGSLRASGGGHAASAGIRGAGDPADWLFEVERRLVEALGGEPRDLAA